MKISILTLFPEVIEPFLQHSIIKRAQSKQAVEFKLFQLRDFTHDKHRTVDDHPFGGGAGMLLKIEPVVEAIEHIENTQGPAHKILLSPKGKLLTQAWAQSATRDHILLICGHYEGFDARISDYIDEELSIGNYVLSSGEAAAIVVVDALVRLLPGVLKKDEATELETFFEVDRDELYKATHDTDLQTRDLPCRQTGPQPADKVSLLEYPQYTLPREYRGKKVPDVLLSGDPKKIREWQLQEAWKATKKRP